MLYPISPMILELSISEYYNFSFSLFLPNPSINVKACKTNPYFRLSITAVDILRHWS